MILPDFMIEERLKLPLSDRNHLCIEPFVRSSHAGCISYGLTSYGYDMRVGNKFKVFTNALNGRISPKKLDPSCFIDFEGPVCVIPPNSFALAASVERFRIPRDILVTCMGKSTYARCGIVCNVTPLEPEWEGHVTVEISNTAPCPAEVFAFEGIMQLVFHIGAAPCAVSYADKKGRYQNQHGITLPFVKEA